MMQSFAGRRAKNGGRGDFDRTLVRAFKEVAAARIISEPSKWLASEEARILLGLGWPATENWPAGSVSHNTSTDWHVIDLVWSRALAQIGSRVNVVPKVPSASLAPHVVKGLSCAVASECVDAVRLVRVGADGGCRVP